MFTSRYLALAVAAPGLLVTAYLFAESARWLAGTLAFGGQTVVAGPIADACV